MPNIYERYVDDSFSIMPNVETAGAFLSKMDDSHHRGTIHKQQTSLFPLHL